MESKKELEKRELAFTDFKNAIPLEEFESVLKIARHEYDSLKRIYDARVEFSKNMKNSADSIAQSSAGMPPGLAEKLIEGLERRASQDIKGYEGAIRRNIHITDFLNRFQDSKQELPYLNFTQFNIKK
jgi:hypothetical protein